MRGAKRLLLTVALLACQREPPAEAAPPKASPPPERAFTLADQAAAVALDARVARLSALAAESRAALASKDRAALRRGAADLDARLLAATSAMDRSLDAIADPRDRAFAVPLASAARRWPALLRQARAQRLARGPAGHEAARALAAADEEVARALVAYRRSRNGWILVDAGPEDPGSAAFLSARRGLEQAETRIGARLPAAAGAAAPDRRGLRLGLEAQVRAARAAANGVDPARRDAAQAWVDAQGRALGALLDLEDAKGPDRPRLSLAYQGARADALEASAQWARLSAGRARR